MKSIKVVAAIIKKDDKIFATKRGYGEFKGGWEFPGGKIEDGESKEEALIREIKEELNADISIEQLFDTVDYDYPTFHLTMYCYICFPLSDNFVLKEHDDAKWLTSNTLDCVSWLPADLELVEKLKNYLDIM